MQLLWSRSLPHKSMVIGFDVCHPNKFNFCDQSWTSASTKALAASVHVAGIALSQGSAHPLQGGGKRWRAREGSPAGSWKTRWDKVLANAGGKCVADGLKLTSRQALGLTWVHRGAQIWGCPCSSAGAKEETRVSQSLFSSQPQGRISRFTQLHATGLLRRGETWIQCSLQPRRFKATSHFSQGANPAITASAEPQPLCQGLNGSWILLLTQRNFKSLCF